jgi:hypothetical protein
VTYDEAKREAERRWGAAAFVAYWSFDHHEVGTIGSLLKVRGEGDSWEAAFADADRRAGDKGTK